MDLSVGANSLQAINSNILSSKTKAEQLESKINITSASDKELLEACKSFESYMLEQVMKGMEKTIPSKEEKNPYLDQFGGLLYEEYANMATENQSIGLAQMLYESMKRNS